jgi:ComF family protein|tara:strand:- start:1466 stop:2122 length:657 start_codon:yes stop_codon:yes gene_type:complete
MEHIRNIVREVLDFLFPPNKIEKRVQKITLDNLSQKTAYREVDKLSGIYALLHYKDTLVRDLIWTLKYRGSIHSAKLLAGVLYGVLLEDTSDSILFEASPHPTVIPLPLAGKRERERGFNQIVLVTDELNKLDENNSFNIQTNILVRTKDTPSQTSLSKEERRENVKGVFTVSNPGRIKEKHIILLDDVITTGSTVKEARRILLDAGAKEVTAIAIAH